MEDIKLVNLAHGTASALAAIDGKNWVLSPDDAGRGFGVDIRNSDGEVVNFQWAVASGRVYIEGMDPATSAATGTVIHVTASRGYIVIAKEISRRLLPGYRRELADRRAHEAGQRAEFEARAAAVNAVERLFGTPTDFGAYNPMAGGEAHYKTEARLALRGAHERFGCRGLVTEYGRVSVTGDGSLTDLELHGIPAAVALRMLRVLADYTAMWPAEPGQRKTEPRPFSAAFEELYDKWLFSGAWQRTDWETWLRDQMS